MSLLISGRLDQMNFEGPFQPKLLYDSMIYLSDCIFKRYLLSLSFDWTDKDTQVKTLGSPRNYCKEHYCEECRKKSGVLPKNRCKAQDVHDSSRAIEGLHTSYISPQFTLTPITTHSWRGTHVTKKAPQNRNMPVDSLVQQVQVISQDSQYFSSPHNEFEHSAEYCLIFEAYYCIVKTSQQCKALCPLKSSSSWNSLAAPKQQCI